MAITWRNINVDLPDPARLLGNAQQAVANVQRTLNEELVRNQELAKHNLEARTNYLKGQLLNYVAGLQTEEDIKRARESGVFNQLLNAIPEPDRSPHVNALGRRLNELRQEEETAAKHEQFMRAQREAPVLDAILSDIYSGDPERMAAARKALTEGSYWQEAPLWRELFNMQRELANRDAAAERQRWERADRHRNAEQQAQLRQIDPVLQRILASGVDEATGRQELLSYLDQNNYPGEVKQTALQRFSSSYQQRYGLTDEQRAQMAAEQARLDARTQAELRAAEEARKEQERLHPQLPVFAFGENNRPSYGKAMQTLAKVDPDAPEIAAGVIEQFRKDYNIPDDFDLGPVLVEAASRPQGKSRFLFPDKKFDSERFRNNLDSAWEEYLRAQERALKRPEFQQNYFQEVQSIQQRRDEEAAKLLERIRNLNRPQSNQR